MKQDADGTWHDDPVHGWFGLSYCAYFVMPRLALEALPLDWQRRFVALMEEAEAMGMRTPGDYSVSRRGRDGRLFSDPWRNYRRGDFLALHGKPLREREGGR